MHYEINVSLNGTHFFATHKRSLRIKSDMEKVHKVFKEKFPESEGYVVSVTLYQTVGQVVTVE